MPRKIADQAEAADAGESHSEEGVAFVKNHTNELIFFPKGSGKRPHYKFESSREVITDPELIEQLRLVADKYSIFETE